VAITGFCWGGRITWLYAARQTRLQAAAAWYGHVNAKRGPLTPMQPVDLMRDLHAPTLGLYGGADTGITAEHLQLMLPDPRAALAAIRHAGAAFLGRFCPEAIGDYVAGPNHVLPTGRTARFASGLSVFDFLKRTTWVEATEAGLQAVGPAAVALADTLENAGAIPGIKWPNDVQLGTRKVAGILTELSADTERVHFLVLGIGVKGVENQLARGLKALRARLTDP
jgi:hypothetical protein